MAMYDSDEHWNNLEHRGIHFLHRWTRGISQISTLLNRPI